MEKKASAGIGFATGIVAALLTLGVIGLTVVYTGAYNVAATEDHTALVRWAFNTTLRNSVEAGADDTQVPENFGEERIAAGAAEYKAMCEHCHSGPGIDRAEWAQGMLPQPPNLVKQAAEWPPSEIFWLVKHGIKMTGMPAFGPTHSDETLWDIAAFVKELPGMTAQQYATFDSGHGGRHGSGHGGKNSGDRSSGHSH